MIIDSLRVLWYSAIGPKQDIVQMCTKLTLQGISPLSKHPKIYETYLHIVFQTQHLKTIFSNLTNPIEMSDPYAVSQLPISNMTHNEE